MISAGGKNFKTKSSLQNYCKFVLNNANINSVLEGEWDSVVRDVLRMHEHYQEKVVDEDYKIGVRQCFINPRNRQFFVLRSDGSDTDFSYMKCISPTNKSSEIKKTLRAAIRDQQESFKDSYFEQNQDRNGYVRCEETGLKLKKKSAHVDHYPYQFDEIVKLWVDDNGVQSCKVKLINRGDNTTDWEMEDKELLNKFIDLHRKVAQYRIVLDKVNLQRGKSKSYKF